MLERKYAMRRVERGTYLLLGNDGESLWLLRKYTDGPSVGLDWPRDREVWDVHRWAGTGKPTLEGIRDGGLAWWTCEAQWLATRREAIDVVLEKSS